MAKKTPPFINYPTWTTARFFGFIRSQLRAGFNRYPPKYETLKAAAYIEPTLDEDGNHVAFKTGRKAGQLKYHKRYLCASCHQTFPQKDVQVDHIQPAGSLRTFEDLPRFVELLYPGQDGLQVLCKPCHLIKTNEERAQ